MKSCLGWAYNLVHTAELSKTLSIPLNGLPFLHNTAEPPQWRAADAEIKVPSGENTELKRSPFKA